MPKLPLNTLVDKDNLRGLRPMDRLRVSYEGEGDRNHDRILLSQVSLERWIILTPDYDMYDESVLEYAKAKFHQISLNSSKNK